MSKVWYKLKDLADMKFKELPVESGVYFVRWAKEGKPLSICRLGGIDQAGLLYIGSTLKLKRRIRDLWKGIKRNVDAHTIGKTIIFCKTFEIISNDEYEVSWKKMSTLEEALGQEWVALHSYACKYKEPPPLNLSLRREMFALVDIARVGKSRIVYEPDEFIKSIIGF